MGRFAGGEAGADAASATAVARASATFFASLSGKDFFVRGSLGEQAIHDNFAAWINVSRAGKIDGPAAREHLLRATILMQR